MRLPARERRSCPGPLSGTTTDPAHELSGEQWFLRVVTELGELMADGSTGPPVTQAAYASRVTRRGIAVLTICAAWLAHHERRHHSASKT